ncbi:lactose-binding lectin l-2-like [Syngnathus typhle]|uniref:lactose-binding lectin l-2-like n=1 Tax=Syngnathus typhle TaxID=161592 RepID=UPI002A6B792B|nr:lactose-binding lectin l-2-like [Syngnathus typhle]
MESLGVLSFPPTPRPQGLIIGERLGAARSVKATCLTFPTCQAGYLRSVRRARWYVSRSTTAKMAFGLRSLFLLCILIQLWAGAWCKPVSHAKANGCPRGWTRLDCRCFIFQGEERTFADSESICNILGGNLVSIHSDLENAVVSELVSREGVTGGFWVGFHDAIEADTFIWTDGTDVDFENFQSWPAEPNNSGDCVNVIDSGGDWGDEDCTTE